MELDFFAVLDLPRHPWVDSEILKKHYRERAAQMHPDRPGGDAGDFALLGQAYRTLSNPAQRLRYLLDLEFPDTTAAATDQAVDPSLFMEVAGLLQSADQALRKLDSAGSQLTRVTALAACQSKARKLEEMESRLDALLKKLEAGLSLMGADWKTHGAEPLQRAAASFSFLQKWKHELREKIFLLSNP